MSPMLTYDLIFYILILGWQISYDEFISFTKTIYLTFLNVTTLKNNFTISYFYS